MRALAWHSEPFIIWFTPQCIFPALSFLNLISLQPNNNQPLQTLQFPFLSWITWFILLLWPNASPTLLHIQCLLVQGHRSDCSSLRQNFCTPSVRKSFLLAWGFYSNLFIFLINSTYIFFFVNVYVSYLPRL